MGDIGKYWRVINRKRWVYIKEFGKKYGINTGLKRSGIGKSCNGIYKKAGGFIWSFVKL